MKAQLPVTAQATLLNLRVVSPGEARGEQGDAVKVAETTRPATDPGAADRSGRAAEHAAQPQRALATNVENKTQLQFSVDEPSGRMIVSIVDRDTSEVVRQIPAEEMLAIARQIEEQLRDAGTTEGLFHTGEA